MNKQMNECYFYVLNRHILIKRSSKSGMISALPLFLLI